MDQEADNERRAAMQKPLLKKKSSDTDHMISRDDGQLDLLQEEEKVFVA